MTIGGLRMPAQTAAVITAFANLDDMTKSELSRHRCTQAQRRRKCSTGTKV